MRESFLIRILVYASLVTALLLAPAVVAGAEETVRFQTEDGVTVVGSLYEPAGGGRFPAVIALHQLGSDRHSWDPLARKLTANNYIVLAIDLRGHGESTSFSGSTRAYKGFTDDDYRKMILDVRAATAYLRGRKNVNAERFAVVGASIGANLALQYAAEDRKVRTAVLLSPGLDYRGLKTLPYMKEYDKRALFMIVAEDDTYSYNSCQELLANRELASPLKLKVAYGPAHGTTLLSAHEGLDEIIIAWLLNHLVNS